MSVQVWDIRTQEAQAARQWHAVRNVRTALGEWAAAVAWANIIPGFGPLEPPLVLFACQVCGQRSRQYGTVRRLNLDGSFRSEIACAGCRGG